MLGVYGVVGEQSMGTSHFVEGEPCLDEEG